MKGKARLSELQEYARCRVDTYLDVCIDMCAEMRVGMLSELQEYARCALTCVQTCVLQCMTPTTHPPTPPPPHPPMCMHARAGCMLHTPDPDTAAGDIHVQMT